MEHMTVGDFSFPLHCIIMLVFFGFFFLFVYNGELGN